MENPYQAPASLEAELDLALLAGDPEGLRQTYLKHEASVRSVGTLYYVGAWGWGLLTLPTLLRLGALGDHSGDVASMALLIGQTLITFVIPATLATLLYFSARGLKRLAPWGRVTGIIGSVVSLVGFPIGTIVGAYALYLLLSMKGKMVFSPEYEEAIAATPHLKCKTSVWVWVILGLSLLLLALSWFMPTI